MSLPNTVVADSGAELTADDTVRQVTLQTPGGIVVNTGSHDMVINVDGSTPTQTQPVGASGRYIPVGAQMKLPYTCSVFSYQDASAGNTTTFLVSKG